MTARACWSGRARVERAIALQAGDVDDRLLAGQRRGVQRRGGRLLGSAGGKRRRRRRARATALRVEGPVCAGPSERGPHRHHRLVAETGGSRPGG